MLGNRSWDEWIREYADGHQNKINQLTHAIGIPTIVISIPLLIASLFIDGLFIWAIGLFIVGWIFQFVGHAFEGKAPEFFKDWRFLFVGLRWWIKKYVKSR